MSTEPVRAGRDWLRLREPADAAARSEELVRVLRTHLSPTSVMSVHDLGCGSGSMGRWLAPRLPGAQHWVLWDRDAELLADAATSPPSAGGAAVTVDTRKGDVTRLGTRDLAGASLITASALLDMLTADELARLLDTCAGAGCPVLFTLSVVGRVDLIPSDSFDRDLMDAFNAHQRRTTAAGTLLGPDAVPAAVDGFLSRGLQVVTRPSPWRLGASSSELLAEWVAGWLSAACEQRPELEPLTRPYARRRLDQLAAGALSVTVHHEDLLALPMRG